MKRFIFLGVLLLAIAGVADFAIRNFTGTGPVPTRSAFSGRLPGVQEGDFRRFQFFYTTNRESSEETFTGRGNTLSDKLTSGTFDVLISPYMPIQPFIWFEETSMKLKDHSVMQEDEFRNKLKMAIQNSPKKSVLVVVWGFRDWFQSAALKTAYTAYALDIDTPVILFDWPGNQGEGSSGYRAAQEVSAKSAEDLGRVLADLIGEAEHVWVMGSSLGCETICKSLIWLNEQPVKRKISEIILAAPDVSVDAFNDKFAESIQNRTKHLTAYVTSNDRALLMSHWLNRQRRLGRLAEVTTLPERRSTEYEFEEAAELLELQERGVRNIALVDVSPINVTRNLHHFFTDSPEFFDDLYQRLLQPEDIVSRRLHAIRQGPQGSTYWLLWNY